MADTMWADGARRERSSGASASGSAASGGRRGPRRRAPRGASRRSATARCGSARRRAPASRSRTAASCSARTERLPVATGIANIWSRDAVAARNGALGAGRGHPGALHARPRRLARAGRGAARPGLRQAADRRCANYLDGSTPALPGRRAARTRSRSCSRRCAPRCSRCRAPDRGRAPVLHAGRAHRDRARGGSGPSRCWRPRSTVRAGERAGRGPRARPAFMRLYLSLPNYTNNLRDLGWGDDDLGGGGSDALVDAIVGWGDVDAVAALRARAPRRRRRPRVRPGRRRPTLAGAVAELEALAPALLG